RGGGAVWARVTGRGERAAGWESRSVGGGLSGGDQLVIGRIDTPQHVLEVGADAVVALAGEIAKLVEVADVQGPTARFEDAGLLELAKHAADVAAADRKHDRQLLLGERNVRAAGAVDRREQPFRSALLDRVGSIAGTRLKDLCGQAVGISGEQILER